MSEQVVQRFIEGLARLEESRDSDTLVSVFAEHCGLSNVVTSKEFEGREGAREFWSQYRDTFGDMKSTFRNVIISGSRAALEWHTEGTTAVGASVSYNGVSILEIEGDQVTRFRAYFDDKALSGQIVKEARA
ncbi:MAG TPA: nuclear transport factor 2 family protein [Blastocatellia bacterium]|jgi:ketosteroid isomerase-like protein